MGLKHYQYIPGDTRRDLIELASFLGQLVGTKKATIFTLLAGSLAVGEVKGVNDSIRQGIGSVLMTPPDQGGPLQSLHDHLRTNYHPDGNR